MNLGDKITISLASFSDISGIAKVLDGTLGQDFVYGQKSFQSNVAYRFIRSIKDKHEGVYVAKENSDVVGLAWFLNHPPNNGTAILEMFAVRKDKQGQGIGSRLIADASDKFVESQRELGCSLRTLHLTTNYSNDRAKTIYSRAGFQVAGKIEGFVGDGNVEVVMIKKLSSESAPIEYLTKR